jgi:hypothetical protein
MVMSILQNLRNILGGTQAPTQSPLDAARTCTSIDDLAAWIGYHDGYVREAALRRAAELASPQLLPAMVERLNDWVPQVRALAQAVLLQMLPSIGIADAMRVLPAVQRLRKAGRADHTAWIASFERALVEKAGPQAIVEGMLDADAQIARACFRTVEATRLAPPEEVIARLLPASRDIVLAKHAAEAIFRLPAPAREPLFRRALASGFGMVRAIALRPLLADENAENDALAIRMATGLHTWTRLIAHAYLARRGIDSAAILAAALCADGSSSTAMRACLAGLAELGARDRLDLVISFTRHPLARVQLSAYQTWLRLDPAAKDAIAREALSSSHRRVRKLALQMAREDSACLDMDAALSVMAAHDDVDMMLGFVRSEPWAWLGLIVQLEPRSHQEAALRTRLQQELVAWVRDAARMYVKPTDAQRALFANDAIVAALAALLPRDEEKLAIRLKFELNNA